MSFLNRICRSILQRGLYAESFALRNSLKHCGKGTRIRSYCVFYHPEHLSIDDDCDIGEFVLIRAGGGVSIGKRVLIAGHCALSSVGHPIAIPRYGLEKAPIKIEDDVWLGAGVIVVPGVTIGEGAVIGAGAVVVNNIAPFSVAVGIPAKVIKSTR